ncbi:unnamed protein product [marine sediment metagenome]|uniref:Uncharacterized protein n=1 Tax=marine sediment metagenome TaxID=412755 RepID=X0YTV9_9ZZZZ
MGDFTREELQRIAGKATELIGGTQGLFWKRAYERLADAATTLDAFMARTEKK